MSELNELQKAANAYALEVTKAMTVAEVYSWLHERALRHTPAPKVDMGPGGLSEAVKDVFEDYDSDEVQNGGLHEMRNWASAARKVLHDALLSSTPPDPSSAAKEAVIEAAWEARNAYFNSSSDKPIGKERVKVAMFALAARLAVVA